MSLPPRRFNRIPNDSWRIAGRDHRIMSGNGWCRGSRDFGTPPTEKNIVGENAQNEEYEEESLETVSMKSFRQSYNLPRPSYSMRR